MLCVGTNFSRELSYTWKKKLNFISSPSKEKIRQRSLSRKLLWDHFYILLWNFNLVLEFSWIFLVFENVKLIYNYILVELDLFYILW